MDIHERAHDNHDKRHANKLRMMRRAVVGGAVVGGAVVWVAVTCFNFISNGGLS